MYDANSMAADAVRLLPCPACGNPEPACRPDRNIAGTPFKCLGCGAIAFARRGDSASVRTGWREGALAWNQWVRRAKRRARERQEGRE